MRRLLGCMAIATIGLAGCESTGEEEPLANDAAAVAGDPVAADTAAAVEGPVAGADALTGFTVSAVTGTRPNGEAFTLRQVRRTLWLYESGDTSVPMDVTDTGETYVEMVGIGDWTGRMKIDLATSQVEVGDRDWSNLTKLPIRSAI